MKDHKLSKAQRKQAEAARRALELAAAKYAKTIFELRAELAEAKRDTERLDWLECAPGSCYASIDPDGDRLQHFVAVPEVPSRDRRGYVHNSVRAAIDAARQGGAK